MSAAETILSPEAVTGAHGSSLQRLVRPYYVDSHCTIYNADCLDMLDEIADGCVLVTDPPYGIGLGTENNKQKSNGYGGHLAKGAYDGYEDTYENFVAHVLPRLNAAIDRTCRACVFTGPHITEQRKPDAIGGIYHPAASGRTVWGSKNFLPILLYGKPPSGAGQHRPLVLQSSENGERNGHPCPKPIGWVKWLLSFASAETETILDPFMGSGTTLLAAKETNRRAIGIEINEAYCEIAANRLAQGVLL